MLTDSQLGIHLLPSICFGMGILVNLSFPAGSSEVKRIAIDKDSRGIIFHGRYRLARDVFPVCQVFGTPVATGLRSKHVIISLEIFQYRVGSLASWLIFILRLETIVQINRIGNNPVCFNGSFLFRGATCQ